MRREAASLGAMLLTCFGFCFLYALWATSMHTGLHLRFSNATLALVAAVLIFLGGWLFGVSLRDDRRPKDSTDLTADNVLDYIP